MPTTMSRAALAEKVREIAAAQAAVEPAEVTEQTDFFADLNYDSLDAVEFIMNLEEAFEISIPDEDAERVKTVGAAVELLCQTLSVAPGREL